MLGPIALDELTPYVQKALGRSFAGVRIAVSGGNLSIDRGTHALQLSLEGVRLSRADGEPVATLPVVSASFSLASLLSGTIAPTRLVVQRPRLRFIRGEDGTVRFQLGDQEGRPQGLSPELLAQLAGPAKPDEPLGKLQQVIVRDATLVLDDRQTGRRWQADRIDATAERAFHSVAGDASMALAVGGGRPEFHASYRYSPADRKLDLVVEMGPVEPAALASLAPEFAPLEAAQFPVSGTLATRLDLGERSGEGLRLDLHFGKGWLNSELLPEGRLALEQGSLHAVYAPETSQLRLTKLELDLGGGSALTFKGSVDGITRAMIAGKETQASVIPGKLGITLAAVPVKKFESLWPPAISHNGRSWVLTNVHDGILDEAAAQLDLEIDPIRWSAEIVAAHGSMRYHDATISYFQGLLPLRQVSGTATLDNKRLVFTPKGGVVNSVQLTGGSLQISDLGAPVEWLTMDISAAGSVRDILEVIDAKPLRYAQDVGLDPKQVAGRAEANFHFKLPLLRDLKLDQVQYRVRAKLTDAAIAAVAMDRDLTDGNLAVEIAGQGARLQGNARFDGVPLDLDGSFFFKPKAGIRARYRAALSLNDAQRQRMGFDFLPGRIAGPVGVSLTYSMFDTAHSEADAALDLQGARLAIAEAGWDKPPGKPAAARIVADLQDERITRIREVAIRAEGLDGRLALTLSPDTGRLDRVDIQRLAVGKDDVAGLVTRHRDGGWHVDLHGPALDLSHWIKDLGDNLSQQSTPADPPLQIDAHLGRVMFGPRREVRDFAAHLVRDGADWQTAQIDARFANGRRLSLRSGKQSLTLSSDDLGSALHLFDITDNIVGGAVTVTGQVEEIAGQRVVNGRIDGGGYSLVRAPAVAQILALPSFSGAGSMLAGSGIPFSTLRGDFAYRGDHLRLDNLLAYGEAIGVTANGTVDLNRDRLDLQGTIVPAYALNSMLGNVPVIGSLLLGGEGQGLFAANYRVTGSTGDPQVSVNPLSALAPGFLRRLLQPNFGLPPPVEQSPGAQ